MIIYFLKKNMLYQLLSVLVEIPIYLVVFFSLFRFAFKLLRHKSVQDDPDIGPIEDGIPVQ